MPTYFRPLRRKIGVITLGLACVVLGVWVWVSTTNSPFKVQNLFMIGQVGFEPTNRGFEWSRLTWDSTFVDPDSEDDRNFEFQTTRHQVWCGFVIEEKTWWRPEPHETIGRFVVWIVPYWSIIVPLTLLSAYLLLSKPRQPESGAANSATR